MKRWNEYPEDNRGLCYQARIDPADIARVVALTEGHEGLAVVRTRDPALGIIEFWVSPSMRIDFEDYLDSLRRDFRLVSKPPQAIDVAAVEQEAVKRPAGNG